MYNCTSSLGRAFSPVPVKGSLPSIFVKNGSVWRPSMNTSLEVISLGWGGGRGVGANMCSPITWWQRREGQRVWKWQNKIICVVVPLPCNSSLHLLERMSVPPPQTVAGSIKTGILCLPAPLESIYLSIYLPKCVPPINRMLKQPSALSLSSFFSELLLLTFLPILQPFWARDMTASLMRPVSNPYLPRQLTCHLLY
jgi:hypothetical protein